MGHSGWTRVLGRATFCLAAVVVGGCSRGEEAVGKATDAPPKPRVVSTVPAATLQIVQLGAVDTLVGVSSYDRVVLPKNKQDLPIVGDYLNLNYEALLALKPTAIVVQTSAERLAPRLKEVCEQQHIQLVNEKLDTLEDLYATALRLGQATDHEQAAKTKVALIKAELAEIKTRMTGVPRPKVLYLLGRSPAFVVGQRGFMDEMLTAAGGDNAGAELKQDFPEVTQEMIVRLAPDVILIAAPDEPPAQADDARLAKWRQLATPAGKTGRVYLVTDPNGQMASLELAASVRILAGLIHPEIALDVSPATAPGGPQGSGGQP